jgi:hypothetical protein
MRTHLQILKHICLQISIIFRLFYRQSSFSYGLRGRRALSAIGALSGRNASFRYIDLYYQSVDCQIVFK